MRTKYTIEERQNLIAQYKQSEQTTREFATENGINPLIFRSWLYTKDRKETDAKAAEGFVEIKAKKE